MSVWSGAEPASSSLAIGEGVLVSVSINVEPRSLESLLEALAQLDFPINPEIYHDAAMVYLYRDGTQETQAATLVEFPAYQDRLPQVRAALAAFGFDPSIVWVAGMMDAIHSEQSLQPAPPGAAYQSRYRVKRRAAAMA
ncbi:MAG TPA: hypothetical protein VME43_23200 [Bryobacteraceae bacterium]|nr:hypothetical protein [Bryobacteraceae bacterium]